MRVSVRIYSELRVRDRAFGHGGELGPGRGRLRPGRPRSDGTTFGLVGDRRPDGVSHSTNASKSPMPARDGDIRVAAGPDGATRGRAEDVREAHAPAGRRGRCGPGRGGTRRPAHRVHGLAP